MRRTSVVEWPVEDLGLTARPYNSLKRGGIDTIGQLAEMGDGRLSNVRHLKPEDVREIRSALKEHGREWRYEA